MSVYMIAARRAAFVRAGRTDSFFFRGPEAYHCALGGVVGHFEAPRCRRSSVSAPSSALLRSGRLAGETALAADLFHRRIEEGARNSRRGSASLLRDARRGARPAVCP